MNTPTTNKSSARAMALPVNIIQPPAKGDLASAGLHSTVSAFRVIDGQLGQVKKLINDQLTAPTRTPYVNQLLEYVNTGSGKMIRPALVLLSGASCGKITGEHIRVAAAIEMIHNATLLHDDVIDEGRIRRGLPTVNNVWGNQSAVLLGDFLLGRVFRMCSDLEMWVGRTIAAAVVRVCEGEIRQIEQRKNWQLSEQEYIETITDKSASLFSCCCSLGGLLSRASQDQVQALADFGLNAGIAFQITDDLLDIIGEENKTGKTLGSDAGKSKLTLAVIHFLKAAEEKEKTEVKNNPDKAAMVEMLNRYGSIEYAHRRAQEYIARAIQALAQIKESDTRAALIETAKFMADRAA